MNFAAAPEKFSFSFNGPKHVLPELSLSFKTKFLIDRFYLSCSAQFFFFLVLLVPAICGLAGGNCIFQTIQCIKG